MIQTISLLYVLLYVRPSARVYVLYQWVSSPPSKEVMHLFEVLKELLTLETLDNYDNDICVF